MTNFKQISVFSIAAVCIFASLSAQSANAQNLIQKVINRGSGAIKTEIGRGTEAVKNTVKGKRYRLRIANASQSGITFYVNGRPHFVAGRKGVIITLNSHQKPQIKFGVGRGNGVKTYGLSSGDYVFEWKDKFIATYGKMRLLDLYRK